MFVCWIFLGMSRNLKRRHGEGVWGFQKVEQAPYLFSDNYRYAVARDFNFRYRA